MTGNAFLKRLRFQLDFLAIEDQEIVLSYYENKIQSADTLTQEEEIVRSFGSPEFIAEKLKKIYYRHLKETQIAEDSCAPESELSCEPEEKVQNKFQEAVSNEKESQTGCDDSNTERKPVDVSDFPADTIKEDTTSAESETEDDRTDKEFSDDVKEDLIFSRSENQDHYSEVIHSIEHNEVMPIFGEKVILSENNTDADEMDPMDRENGLTPEEIEEAKKETLEKAKNYTTESFIPIEEGVNIPLEPDENQSAEESNDDKPVSEFVASEKDNLQEEAKNEYIGVFNKPFSGKTTSRFVQVLIKILFTLLCLPVFIPVILGMVAVYGIIVLAFVALIVLLFIVDLGSIIVGIIELAYGFTLLFDTVSVALIELGLGTVLFGLVVAFSALIYEFLFSVMPRLLKKVTRQFKTYMKKFICYFYGGKA